MVSSSGSVVSLCPFWGQKVSTVLALLRQVVGEPRHRSLGQHVVQLLPQDQHLCWVRGYGVHDAIERRGTGQERYLVPMPDKVQNYRMQCMCPPPLYERGQRPGIALHQAGDLRRDSIK